MSTSQQVIFAGSTPGDLSIVAHSYMTVEALHAHEFLEAQGITCDLIDLRTVKPIDWKTVTETEGTAEEIDSGELPPAPKPKPTPRTVSSIIVMSTFSPCLVPVE